MDATIADILDHPLTPNASLLQVLREERDWRVRVESFVADRHKLLKRQVLGSSRRYNDGTFIRYML